MAGECVSAVSAMWWLYDEAMWRSDTGSPIATDEWFVSFCSPPLGNTGLGGYTPERHQCLMIQQFSDILQCFRFYSISLTLRREARKSMIVVRAHDFTIAIPKLHSARTVACGLLRCGRCSANVEDRCSSCCITNSSCFCFPLLLDS